MLNFSQLKSVFSKKKYFEYLKSCTTVKIGNVDNKLSVISVESCSTLKLSSFICPESVGKASSLSFFPFVANKRIYPADVFAAPKSNARFTNSSSGNSLERVIGVPTWIGRTIYYYCILK